MNVTDIIITMIYDLNHNISFYSNLLDLVAFSMNFDQSNFEKETIKYLGLDKI